MIQTIIALSIVAAAIVLLASPLGATHQAQAQVGGGGSGGGGHGGGGGGGGPCGGHVSDCDQNPTTGNPHPSAGPNDPSNPQGNEVGNPHNSGSPNCTGDPHGDVGTDVCHGSQ